MKPVVVIFLFALLSAIAIAEKPMNIVIFCADDIRHDSLGVAGNPVVKTPRIDQLAKESVRFTNSYVTTSIRWMRRASLFTGQSDAGGCSVYRTGYPRRNYAAWSYSSNCIHLDSKAFVIEVRILMEEVLNNLGHATRRLGSGTIAIQVHDPQSVIHYKSLRLRKLP